MDRIRPMSLLNLGCETCLFDKHSLRGVRERFRTTFTSLPSRPCTLSYQHFATIVGICSDRSVAIASDPHHKPLPSRIGPRSYQATIRLSSVWFTSFGPRVSVRITKQATVLCEGRDTRRSAGLSIACGKEAAPKVNWSSLRPRTAPLVL